MRLTVIAALMRFALALVVTCLCLARGAVTADARPRLVVGPASVEAAGPRVVTVRGTLAPAGRRVAYHLVYRRLGRAWMRTPRRWIRKGRRRAVTTTLTALRPGFGYGVRLVATTCGGCRSGTARTRERLFRTPPEPALVPAEPPPADVPTLAPARTAETPAVTASSTTQTPEPEQEPPPEGSYRNPIWDSWEFPDPTVIRVGSTHYAYATGERFQVMRSTDLVNWEWLGLALSERPSWAVASGNWHPWAPSVLPTSEPCPGATTGGCFLLFYVGLSDKFGTATTNCVGLATSATPEGPFTDRGPLEHSDGTRDGGWPIGCGDEAGYGNIDPQPFIDDDGKAWLYVSTDWRCTDDCRLLPEISVIPLSADRLSASGARQPLLPGEAGTWEQAPWAPVVENPWILKRGSTYHLLYSGGSWQGHYAMGHATAPSPTGPFTRTSTEPWTGSTDAVKSMGGGMVVADGAEAEWLVYHGRDGSLDVPRTLRIDRLSWTEDERPRLDGPSTDTRTAPVP